MTVTQTESGAPSTFGLATVSLYRDIHKGIRSELFSVTSEAGRIDPADRDARVALADHVDRVCQLLVEHAEHEDDHIQAVLEDHRPEYAREIAGAHSSIDETMVVVRDWAGTTVGAPPPEQRGRVDRLYLDLAAFTATYLEHQGFEERTVMPALESAIGVEGVIGLHQAIIASIPPEEMARSLAIMFPAMNVDDRCELLGGMQVGAPPEVFAGIWALAGSVLDEGAVRAVAGRLGL